ncbi:MAG: GHKL domain-containing protein, partial [Alphaproteobacteria bacterium]|nr:GHKL domain-containing protein [Alphaproteobacteria bacterium]
ALRAALANLEVATAEAGALIYPGDLPRVMADEGQLIRLFQNLIDNAIKYRAPERPPVVHVNAAFNGEVWVFSVSDNGIGIDPKHFDRVFTIFQRLHGRDEYSGTGIGLAVCKKIVERHGGRIWIESTPNEGSTFLFTLGALPVPTETVPDAGHERGETR